MLVVLKHRVVSGEKDAPKVSGEKGAVDDGAADNSCAEKEPPQPHLYAAENFLQNRARTLYTTGHTNQDVGYMHVHPVRKDAESTNGPTPTTEAIADFAHYFNCHSNKFVTPPNLYNKLGISDNKADSIVILGKRMTINRDKGVSNVLTPSLQSNLCTDKTPNPDQYSSQDVEAVALEATTSATPHPLADIIGDYGNRADTIRKWFAAHQNHHSALLSPHDLASVLAQIIFSLQEEKALHRDAAAELVRAAGVLAEEMHRWRR
eukprot:CAMPEP_0194304202 /NCGR_PEP_ID=MMETSP0171-20130528/1987_1 /TAXON_ID=218684 /ORGANISM="Corethron pennatum, Strain L29A3" /LENGTH=262 /DNA_ID=CAMNT_0039055395 /DNA_START=1 /DNA_END=785 /DNA_ORIENTATION=+